MSKKGSKIRLHIFLPPETYEFLQSLKARKGISLSQLIEEAISESSTYSEMKNELIRAGREFRALREELKAFNEKLEALLNEFSEIKKWLKVNAFWGALATELLKTRFFDVKPLTKEEFEKFKETWEWIHEVADRRVESLVGEKVWKKSFNPKER